MNAGKSGYRCGTTNNQHERYEDICHQPEYHKDDMGDRSVPSLDSLEECVSIRRAPLELDGDDGEDQDLDCGAAGVPEGAGDPIPIANPGALEKGGCPCP
jgi:hypothetical protein